MSSPVARTVRDLTVTIASLADATLGTFDFPHPDTPNLATRGKVVTLGLGAGHSPAEGGSNSLPPSQTSDPSTTDLEHHGGMVSVGLNAILGIATAFVRAIRLIDKDGNVLQSIYDDAVGIPANSTTAIALMKQIPVKTDEGIRLEVFNGSGGALVLGGGTARYDLGINVQVADLSGQVPTI